MTRLIDADDLKKAFKKSPFVNEVYLYYARQLINLAPTVEERPHGEWISLEKTRCKGQLLPFWRTHECSVCSSTGQGDFNFCPKCGADMRGKNNE